MISVPPRITFAQAALALHEEIVKRWGCDPEVVEDLEFTIRRCAIGDTGLSCIAIVASPEGEIITRANMIASLFGDIPPGMLRARD